MKSLINIFKLWETLSRKRKFQVFFLMLSTLLSGMLEAFSLASFMPFLSALIDSKNITNQPIYKFIKIFVADQLDSNILLSLTIIFILLTTLTAFIRILNLWYAAKISSLIGSDIGVEVYKKSLYRPYIDHLTMNSSTILNAVTYQSPNVLGVFYSTNFVITSSFVSLCLIIGLILIDAKLAFLVSSLVGLIYLLISYFVRKYLIRNSKVIDKFGNKQIQSLQEGLGLIRDIILENSYNIFINKFKYYDKELNTRKASNKFFSTFPRFLLESIALIFLSVIALIISTRSSQSASFIPLFGTYALGAQRLISSSQQIYSNWSNIEAKSKDISKILSIVKKGDFLENNINYSIKAKSFKNSISLNKVNFKYPNTNSYTVKDLDLSIKKGEKVALIGITGAGKSTLVDILMGLIEPLSGTIEIDGSILNYSLKDRKSNLIAWRKAISHVPQSIFLADTSFTENIALGIPKALIDYEQVINAAQIARIHDFILDSPQGYNGFVGERGIRISGGQRQRIGIARAIYKNPKILILDEATSALDNLTEEMVMNSINSNCSEMTIIMIAHRYSSIRNFDRVIKLEKGKILKDGPPELVLPS